MFLKCKQEDNVTWALEVCQSMLKDQEKMPHAIVIDCDTTLMNSVAKVFPASYALLCRFHITKHVRGRVKPKIGTK